MAQVSNTTNSSNIQSVTGHRHYFPVPVSVAQEGLINVRAITKGPNSEVTTSYELYVRQE